LNFRIAYRTMARLIFRATLALRFGRRGRRTQRASRFCGLTLARAFSDIDIANAEIVFGELCGNVVHYAEGLVEVIVDSSGIQTVLHGGSHARAVLVGRYPISLLREETLPVTSDQVPHVF
jgi:hypothetical protein